MAVAQERARIRGLDNVRWIKASLMNLPELGLGQFDYISCTGVLHHLESSEAGLAILRRLLKPDGVIYLMLYGRYGRRPVYDMQALLREYLPPAAGMAEKVRMTRELLAALPATNSFSRDLERWGHEIGPDGFGDAGLYDLLLHSQDGCFGVPGIYALAASAGLDLLAFVDRAGAYDPLMHLRDKAVDAIVNAGNRSLRGGGGVDGAIHRAGGPKILEECIRIGGCETGEAVITTGGNLRAKYVIHTVGPVYRDGKHNEPKLLQNAYANSLKLASSKGLKSVAFPSISTGAYGYPLAEAAEIALRTASGYLREHSDIGLVRFVLFGQKAFEAYRKKLQEIA